MGICMYDVPRFWVQMDTCAVGVYQALLPRREGPGDEVSMTLDPSLYKGLAHETLL